MSLIIVKIPETKNDPYFLNLNAQLVDQKMKINMLHFQNSQYEKSNQKDDHLNGSKNHNT